jgi:hypothetical protein
MPGSFNSVFHLLVSIEKDRVIVPARSVVDWNVVKTVTVVKVGERVVPQAMGWLYEFYAKDDPEPYWYIGASRAELDALMESVTPAVQVVAP